MTVDHNPHNPDIGEYLEFHLESEILLQTRRYLGASQALASLLHKDEAARRTILGYSRFQLEHNPNTPGQGDYSQLSRALEYLGRKYILPQVKEEISALVARDIPRIKSPATPATLPRIVEFGPGSGWLIQELLHSFQDHFYPFYALDKRFLWTAGQMAWNWEESVTGPPLKSHVFYYTVDLETELFRAMDIVKPGSDLLIIANNFLHCIDNPAELVHAYRDATWLVIEPDYDEPDLPHLWDQLTLFGSTPMSWNAIDTLFEKEKMIPRSVVFLPIGQVLAIYSAGEGWED